MTTALNGKKIFGPGRFFGINNVTNPTPMRPYLVQDQSVTFKREVKEIYGENQLAADVASGTLAVSGKVTFGASNARLFADLMFADSGAAGQINESDGESGIVAGSTPFIITVANSTAWTVDLGVIAVATGVRYARVANGSEVAGASYSVAAGVYTFAAGDEGKQMKISYLYSVTATGETITLINQKQGKVGNFTSVMVFPWGAEQDVLTLNSCLLSDTEISSKTADYAKPTLGFTAACDTTDTLGTFSFAETA